MAKNQAIEVENENKKQLNVSLKSNVFQNKNNLNLKKWLKSKPLKLKNRQLNYWLLNKVVLKSSYFNRPQQLKVKDKRNHLVLSKLNLQPRLKARSNQKKNGDKEAAFEKILSKTFTYQQLNLNSFNKKKYLTIRKLKKLG